MRWTAERYKIDWMDDFFACEREAMVHDQIERRGLHNQRLLAALRAVPRHHFVPVELRDQAYEDCPLPIGWGQTISQPYIVALMTSLLSLAGEENVLEIGTGSGYQAAILARLAKTVHTVERIPELADQARFALSLGNVCNVTVHTGDGSLGWPESAPYDGILITAAAPRAPQCILDQLADGGKLVLPVGPQRAQTLQVWARTGDHLQYENILPVAFVPLRGEHGWEDKDWR